MKIISVVGARPNFMKIAPFIHAINAHNGAADGETIDHILVHTGQHYDDCMSRSFFEDLNIPDADINLGIGSGSHAEQVGNTMIAFEKVLQQERPDWVVVVGDVNATCACSITAKKEHVKLAHIEAGLRSRDMTMPEEINRLVTDRLADLLLTPDRLSSENLLQEGVPEEKIRLVGNIMIDTLEAQRSRAEALDPYEIVSQALLPGQADLSPEQKRSVRENRFAAMTMHRPSNVDEQKVLTANTGFFDG
uniref:UDP-N-acetyl glucosamine 2-epimerase n=1 Tax=Candidatus Electrothrix sp. TaxID=2170559 RepID=UPI00405796EF